MFGRYNKVFHVELLYSQTALQFSYSTPSERETLVGPHLPQLEVRVVGGGDLGGKATQVSVVNGVSGRETSLD